MLKRQEGILRKIFAFAVFAPLLFFVFSRTASAVCVDMLDYFNPSTSIAKHISTGEVFYNVPTSFQGRNGFYIVKVPPGFPVDYGAVFEEFTYDSNFIYHHKDTSWATAAGNVQCNGVDAGFTLVKGAISGCNQFNAQNYAPAPWIKRQMCEGDVFSSDHTIVGFAKDGSCTCCWPQYSGYVGFKIKFVKHYDTFSTGTGVGDLSDVIEVEILEGNGAGEVFYYSKNYGWFGFGRGSGSPVVTITGTESKPGVIVPPCGDGGAPPAPQPPVGNSSFGYNMWWLAKAPADYISQNLDFVSASCGSSIVRFWGFEEYGVDGVGRVLSAASGKNVKFIISLSDYNNGGINGDAVNWYKSGYKNSFRPYVQSVVSAFAGNGQVLAWEIMNEGHCNVDSQECKDAFVAFMDDMSSLIHSADSDGTYISAGMKAFPEAGDLDGTYQRISALPNITANSCHQYNTDGADKHKCSEARDIVKGLGKYFYVGESGFQVCSLPGCNYSQCTDQKLQDRKGWVGSDMASIGADAYLVWQYNPQSASDYPCDDFSVMSGDPLCDGSGVPPPGSPPPPVPGPGGGPPGGPSPASCNIPPGTPTTVSPVNGQCPSGYALVGTSGSGSTSGNPSPPDNNIGNSPIVPVCGVNYNPTYHTWQRMWTEWDPVAIKQELGYAKEMGINMVKNSVHYDTFGRGTPNAAMIDHLKEFVNIAGGLGIKSVISLFDGEPRMACDYDNSPSEYEAQARAVVTALESNSELLWWDVTNEPDNAGCPRDDYIDPDTGIEEKGWRTNVLKMAQFIKSISNKPITVGFSNWQHNGTFVNSPYIDIIQIHSYWEYDDIKNAVLDISDKTNKKIFIGEFGMPYGRTAPWGPYADGNILDEADQTDYYRKVAEVLDNLKTHDTVAFSKIIGVAPWTLMEIVGSPDGEWGLIGRDLFFNTPGKVYASSFCGASVGDKPVSAGTGGSTTGAQCVLQACCSTPLPANPEPGCFNCNFSGSTQNQAPASPISAFLQGVLSFVIKQAAQLGVNYNATVKVQEIKAPVTENDLVRWYGKVGSDGKVKDNSADVGRLAYFLGPEDAKKALEQGTKYKDTVSLVEYAAEPQGSVTATYGKGSTKQIYGAQNAASVVGCLLTGTPDDPECESADSDLVARTDKYLALVKEDSYKLASGNDEQISYDKSQEEALQKTVSALTPEQKQHLLASADSSNLYASAPAPAQNIGGEVLSFGVPNFGSCPAKKDSPTSDFLCQKSYQDITIRGVVKNEWYTVAGGQATDPRCNTTETLGVGSSQVTASGGCSFSDRQRVSIAPRFSFATGTTLDNQLGFIPAVNKISAIFWDPSFTVSETQKQTIKQKNDGKVPFVPVAVVKDLTDPEKQSLLSRVVGVVQSIVNAVFQVDTNSNFEANVENNKKRECYEKILEQSQLMAPELAKPIDPDCLEPKSDTSPIGNFPTNCGAGIFDWNNGNTVGETPTTPPLASAPLVGKLQGKIILADGATLILYGKQVPKNAGNGLPTGDDGISHSRCGLNSGAYPPVVRLYRVAKNATSWANASVYKIASIPEDKPYHINFDLSVPEGKYAFTVEDGACWNGFDINSVPIGSALTITSGASTKQCFSVVANSVMPGAHSSVLNDPANPDNIASYCGIQYDAAYNSLCGGKDQGCGDDGADCTYLRTQVPGWPQVGNSCRDMFPSKFKKIACDAPAPVLANLRMYDISCVDEDKCFIAANKVEDMSDLNAGEDGAYFVKSTGNGNWVAKPFVYNDGVGGVFALTAAYRIRFLSPTLGYAVGKATSGGQTNLVLRTTDGGENWGFMSREMNSCDRQNLTALDMLSATTGFIGPSSSAVTWRMSDGTVWNRFAYTVSNRPFDGCTENDCTWKDLGLCVNPVSFTHPRDSFIDVSMPSYDHVVAATNRNSVIDLQKQGNDWVGLETQVCSTSTGRMEKVRMLSDTLGYAAGRDGCAVKYTDNSALCGGVAPCWIQLSSFPSVSFLGLDSTNNRTVFTGSGGTIAILEGGGGTPRTPASGVSVNLWGAEVLNNSIMYAIGDSGTILKSSDGGATWVKQIKIATQEF